MTADDAHPPLALPSPLRLGVEGVSAAAEVEGEAVNKTILICGTVCVVAVICGLTFYHSFRSPEAAVMDQCVTGILWGKAKQQLACAEAIYGDGAR